MHNRLDVIIDSNSWKLTRPLRGLKRWFSNAGEILLTSGLALYRAIPLSWHQRDVVRRTASRLCPFLVDRIPASQNGQGAQQRRQDFELITERTPVRLLDASPPDAVPVRLLAFYLPQFHPIPENDEWWGTGFTEWANVKRATPLFLGHYQPRIPGELGYYDLRNPEVQARQVALAKLYGLGGFCFYFYWFAGKRLLEAPTLQYLRNRSLDFPFCLCWANENWSRRWDGLEQEILIAQRHSSEDDLAFIAYIKPYLTDPRYIRINGRPLLLVYRPSLLPAAAETTARWRTWCRDNGVGDIYLACTQSFEVEDPAKYGFDAAVEFAPNNSAPPTVNEFIDGLPTQAQAIIYDWSALVNRSEHYQQVPYTLFRGVNPMWDNTARRKDSATVFVNSSPEQYQRWLTRAVEDTLEHRHNPDERIVFVNAWNEWAEGAYLEPDQDFGYAYLDATRRALENSGKTARQRQDALAIVVHAFYPEVLKDLLQYIATIPASKKLYVTTTAQKYATVDKLLAQCGFPYVLLEVENRGRDVLPFLKIMPLVKAGGHRILLKIHTKKSTHRQDGDVWRNDLLDKLMSRESSNRILSAMHNNASLGMVGAEGHIVCMTTYWGANRDTVLKLAAGMGIAEARVMATPFVAGTMFYTRIAAIEPLLELPISDKDFEEETGQVDGTLAHAIERALAVAVVASNYAFASNATLEVADYRVASIR